MFTYINRLNGQSYDVMLYDSKTNVALLHPINKKSNSYLIVENLNLNGNGLGDNVISFDDYNEARNYFVLNQYNSLDYKTQFFNILKEEDINIDNVNLDSLYARWMNDSSITGFIDRESIERIVEEEKEERSSFSYNSGNFNIEKNRVLDSKDFGNIIQDIVNLARTSDNNTWFLEADNFIDGTYTQDDLDQLNKDIQKLRDLGVEDVDTIIEAYSDFDGAIESGEPVATFYGSFLDLFEENEIEAENKDSQSLVDKINEIDDELSNTLDSIQSLEDDNMEI